MFDWDDLRFFLAIARGGSLAAAARRLGVTHSTVFRRLNGFEASLGVRLFERRRDGYMTTPEGAEMLARAGRIEEEILGLDRRLGGRDLRLAGSVRLTAPDTVALGLLPPHLARFREAYPDIALEIAVSNLMFSISRREADVAIRPTTRLVGDMVGRKVAGVAFAVYGAEGYLAARGAPAGPQDLPSHDLVGPDESLAGIGASAWLRRHAGRADYVCRCDSLLAQVRAVAAGMGLGVLPCFLGDREPGLRRVLPPDPAMGSELWLFTHEDLRRTARIRAFLDFMAEALGAERDLLEGRRGGPAPEIASPLAQE